MLLRIRIRIYLLARRNLLWDILRLPSSRRAALGLYVILTLWRGRGANQPPYTLLHRSSPRYALRHGRRLTSTLQSKAAVNASLTIEVSASLSHCSTVIWCFWKVEERRWMSSRLLWVLSKNFALGVQWTISGRILRSQQEFLVRRMWSWSFGDLL